jgi:hypothetical protein
MECTANTCPYLWILRERLGKVIECGNCSYLFARPLAFYRDISVRPGVPYAPYRPFASLPSSPSSPPLPFLPFNHRPPPSSLLRLPSPRAVFPTTMAGKSQILPVDTWARSLVMERRLEELVHDGLLRSRASRTQPKWRVPPSDHREPTPPGATW